MREIFFSFLIIIFSFLGIFAQEKTEDLSLNVPKVDYCEIIKNPQNYNGKMVSIFDENFEGFEISSFLNQTCTVGNGQILIEWEKYQSCGDTKTAQILANRNKYHEITGLEGNFVGKFIVKQGERGFGHFGLKPFKLEVYCMANATLLPKENSGCRRIDETSPFHYLDYVKTEISEIPNNEINSKKKSGKVVWFRLVNNSSCSIVVSTLSTKAENLINGATVLVNYVLDPTIKTSFSTWIPLNGKYKSITEKTPVSSTLLSGNFIYFGVPLKHFLKTWKVRKNYREHWNISVPFKYLEKDSEKSYEPFYFSWRDLPKELFT